MPVFKIDPLKELRKGIHVWRGENAVISYNEGIDGSFRVLILYDSGDKKRRLAIEINEGNQKVEFKNDELSDDLYQNLVKEISVLEAMTKSKEEEQKKN